MYRIAEQAQRVAAREMLISRLNEVCYRRSDQSIPTPGGRLERGHIFISKNLSAHIGRSLSTRKGGNLWEISFRGDGRLISEFGPSIEFNLPSEGYWTKLIAGRIVIDDRQKLYLGHKGVLSGGYASVKSVDFERLIRGFKKVVVTWPDQTVEKIFVVGQLDSEDFICQLTGFVCEAERIREMKRRGEIV